MSKLKHYKDSFYKEEYYEETFDNGLTVIYYPKNEFATTLGILGVNYGSIDINYKKQDKFISTPLGVAHFLEHKMFEISPTIDASTLFSNWGVDSNAFTTYDHTAYYFSSVTHVVDSLKLLLQFVLNHNFESCSETIHSIEKEKGIITEELKMYIDDEQSAMHLGLLKAIYKTNPVSFEIGGTVSSIKKINLDVLNECYHSFYKPKNMVLVLIGKMNRSELHNVIEKELSNMEFEKDEFIPQRAPLDNGISTSCVTKEYMEVATPMVGIALPFPICKESSLKRLEIQFALDIISDIFFDKASDNYNYLIKDKWIDYSFDYGIYYEMTYGLISLQSNTNRVDETLEEFKKCLYNISLTEVKEATFLKYKKIQLARILRKLSDLEYVANLMIELKLVGVNLFDYLKLLQDLSLENIKECQKLFCNKAYGIHIILPNKEKGKN